MACPYYRERLGGKVIGYCKDSRENIPSQKHQDCLCMSSSGMYSDFCPIYSKLQQNGQKHGFLSRIFTNGQKAKVQNRAGIRK
jgi:hypothetical protein